MLVNIFCYSRGEETWDTWRYARSSSFPLTTNFKDSHGVQWTVTLRSAGDQGKFVVPFSREIKFTGDEGDRVGLPSHCKYAELGFTYQPKSQWHSHGIRLRTRCYYK